MCHEWQSDGGTKKDKGKHYKTGFWHRLEWPDGQPLLKQPNLLVEIFRIINHEESRL